jgi:hypothetical protein
VWVTSEGQQGASHHSASPLPCHTRHTSTSADIGDDHVVVLVVVVVVVPAVRTRRSSPSSREEIRYEGRLHRLHRRPDCTTCGTALVVRTVAFGPRCRHHRHRQAQRQRTAILLRPLLVLVLGTLCDVAHRRLRTEVSACAMSRIAV